MIFFLEEGQREGRAGEWGLEMRRRQFMTRYGGRWRGGGGRLGRKEFVRVGARAYQKHSYKCLTHLARQATLRHSVTSLAKSGGRGLPCAARTALMSLTKQRRRGKKPQWPSCATTSKLASDPGLSCTTHTHTHTRSGGKETCKNNNIAWVHVDPLGAAAAMPAMLLQHLTQAAMA